MLNSFARDLTLVRLSDGGYLEERSIGNLKYVLPL